MIDRMEWSAVVDQSLSDVIRERANSALVARVEHEILAPWRAAYAADPTSPPPPDTSLAVSPWWWTSINAATLDIEACGPELDPYRLGATDSRTATHLPWAVNQIAAFRALALRAAARELFDALVAGEVCLTGIREPSIAHGGARQDVPAAALRSRQWRLTTDSTLISLAIGTSDTVAFSDTKLAVAAAAEIPSPAADPRPKPTDTAVRLWMRERVATWPDDQRAPSEKKDWIAVHAHFGDGLRRNEDFRPIRETETPPEWRTQGPRPPWGKVKNTPGHSAKNSAKLPTQN